MHLAISLVAIAAVVIVIASFCDRKGLPAPLILTVVGLGASFLPFVHVTLDPELVLLGLLPPLLYAAAVQVSLVDFRSELRPIALLSVGLVIFTAAAVGAVTFWLLPVSLATAFALGAIVGPPDAVAATAIGRGIGLPRRIVTVLEGESLVNDATAIVLLRTAIAGIVGTVTVQQVAGGFALSAIGGVVIGVVVGVVVGWLHRRLSDPMASTALSLITPWVAYIPAEEVHSSGVLAVVVAGLLLAHKSPLQQTATARLAQRINWGTIQFFLENAVFLLIGLQVQDLVLGVADSPLGAGRIVAVCLAVLGTTIVARLVWLVLTRPLMRTPDRNGVPLSWRDELLIGWAGMRGVVTLAAAFILPEETAHRSVLLLAALVVVAGSLLLQGSTLPWLARALKVRGPDPRADALAEAQLIRTINRAGLERLETLTADDPVDREVLAELRSRSEQRMNKAWERLRAGAAGETPSQTQRRLRLAMLRAQREELMHIRGEGRVDGVVLASALNGLDVEESMLERIGERARKIFTTPVAAPAAVREECEHLAEAERHPDPEPSGPECAECAAEGTDPVHLRVCLTCGHVGCCDSSSGRHAERHYLTTHHPVMRSFEPDEVWRWCYVDEKLG